MKVNMSPSKMLDSEKVKLYERITQLVGEKFAYLITPTGGWKQREIHEQIGIPESRQSEYKDFGKYGRRISKRDLTLCLAGGIITVEELIKEVAEDDKEIEYLKTLEIYEDVPLQKIIQDVREAGLNPTEILKAALGKHLKK